MVGDATPVADPTADHQVPVDRELERIHVLRLSPGSEASGSATVWLEAPIQVSHAVLAGRGPHDHVIEDAAGSGADQDGLGTECDGVELTRCLNVGHRSRHSFNAALRRRRVRPMPNGLTKRQQEEAGQHPHGPSGVGRVGPNAWA